MDVSIGVSEECMNFSKNLMQMASLNDNDFSFFCAASSWKKEISPLRTFPVPSIHWISSGSDLVSTTMFTIPAFGLAEGLWVIVYFLCEYIITFNYSIGGLTVY